MNHISDNSFYYLWLQQILGVGSGKLRDVLEFFGTAEEVYNSSFAVLSDSGLFSDSELKRKNNIGDKKLLDILKYSQENSIRVITPENVEYPETFKYIEAPPAVLFARGLPLQNKIPYFGIVGARNATVFGRKAAFSLAARLTLSGFTIVSGDALGIDKMAHIGSLAAGGNTVAVLGSGIDSNYLKANKPLRDRIEKCGTLISEFSPLAPATRYTFPIRNRLISALSGGVAVIEAGCKSGALITASYAMEQGKEVFAVPGSIGSSEYDGSNQLLRDGAIPLISVDDVISVYSGRFEDKINSNNRLTKDITAVLYKELEIIEKEKVCKTQCKRKPEKASQEKTIKDEFSKPDIKGIDCSNEAKNILISFEHETEMSDILSSRSGLSGAGFITAVTELELKGYIKAVPVGRYKMLFK